MKVLPKKKWQYPIALEREYSKHLVRFVNENMEVVKQFIPQMEELLLIYGVKMDSDSPAVVQLDILMDKIHMEMKNPEQMLPVIEAMSIRVDSYNKQQWDAIIKSVLGMPMRDIPFDRIVRQDAEADNTLREMWVAENLDYLRNVDEQTMQKIKQMLTGKIVGNVNRRELSKELIDEIEKITEFERNRAVLIARDQVGKLNGKLMEYRQTHAGITEYKWSSSHDQRVRPTHREYDGKIYTWGSKSPHPNPEGSPGMPIRCRCVAIPVIDLDKIVTKPVPQSYVQVKNPIQNRTEDSIIKEKLYPKTLAGVKRGDPMTFDDADHGRGNAMYQKEKGCDINCQTCVVAHEARLRGYNVTAKGNYRNATAKSLSYNTSLIWLDPVTNVPISYITDRNNLYNSRTWLDFLHKKLKQGERYTLEFAWKGKGFRGHIVNMWIENGKVIIYDAQTDKLYKEGQLERGKDIVLTYFSRFKWSALLRGQNYFITPKIMRIDNAIIDPNMASKVLRKYEE